MYSLLLTCNIIIFNEKTIPDNIIFNDNQSIRLDPYSGPMDKICH